MSESESNKRGRAAVAALPDSIRVGAYDIAIVKWPMQEAYASERYGEFSKPELLMRIQVDMPSAARAVDIFMHETLHAMFWAYGIENDDNEERTVGHLGTALMAAFRDNPWLGEWIDDALNPVPNGPSVGELIEEAIADRDRQR